MRKCCSEGKDLEDLEERSLWKILDRGGSKQSYILEKK